MDSTLQTDMMIDLATVPDPINDLVTVVQLPVIQDRLKIVKPLLEARLQVIMEMQCSEATLKETKAMRAAIRKEAAELEARRKQVKQAITEPYAAFEAVYKDCVGDIYEKADHDLKSKIDAVTSRLQEEKEAIAKQYFNEYLIAKPEIPYGLISYEDMSLKITQSMTAKKAKEAVREYVDRVQRDCVAISQMGDSAAYVMSEYEKCLDLATAMQRNEERQKAVERYANKMDMPIAGAQKPQGEREGQAPYLSAPERETTPRATAEATAADSKLYSVSFTVNATIGRLKLLRKFLEEGEYTYESI